MEFKHTLGVLYNQADEIRKMAARLQESETRIIDLDLMLEKLRNIYDLIIDLEAALPDQSKQELHIQEDHDLLKAGQSKNDEPLEIIYSKKEIEEKADIEVPYRVEDKKNDSDSRGNYRNDKELVSDRFKGSKHTLHEEMTIKSKKEDISTQFKSKPINNILGAIALNERFELINQLFQGDKASFERTMEALNLAGSFVEAYNYLQENFKWDMDNEYVQRILELIRRKLIVRRNDQ
jgi:hypothetical protein